MLWILLKMYYIICKEVTYIVHLPFLKTTYGYHFFRDRNPLTIFYFFSFASLVALSWRTKDNYGSKLNGKRVICCSRPHTINTTTLAERITIKWSNFTVIRVFITYLCFYFFNILIFHKDNIILWCNGFLKFRSTPDHFFFLPQTIDNFIPNRLFFLLFFKI